MSLRPLASLAVKMLGLYAIVNSLPTISTTLFSLLHSPSYISPLPPAALPLPSPIYLAFLYASGGALQILFGLALWWFSDGIARMAVPSDGDIPVRKDEMLIAIGFSVVGAYLLSRCAVSLSHYGTSLYLATRYAEVYYPEKMGIGAQDLIPLLVQGTIALYLLFAGRGLARVVANLKDIGRERDVAPSEAD